MRYIKYITLTIYLVLFHADQSGACTCPDGWITFRNSCYFFRNVRTSFSTAEQFCRNKGGHLVHVNDNAENNFIRTWVKSRLQYGHWWIGLSDRRVEGRFKWIDDNESPTFTDWNPGEPTNYNNIEDCVQLWGRHDWKWNDVPCTDEYNSICEKSTRMVNSIVGYL